MTAMLRIDMHSHLLPRDWPDLNERFNTKGFPTVHHDGSRCEIHKDGRFFRALEPNAWDLELRIEQYASMGVQVQVASTVPVMFSYQAKAEHALYLAQFLNDALAAQCTAQPDHLLGLGTVPMQDPALAIREMQRCVQELGLHGLQIGSHINDWNLDHEALRDFFAVAADIGCPILVHPWDMMGKESMGKYWLPWLVGMPAEQSRAMCSMIMGGVLRRFPKLRVLFAHGGGAFPFTLGRIEHGYRMRPDLVAMDSPDRSPREYLQQIYVDSCVHDAQALTYLVELFGSERIAMGSDYPFPLGEAQPGSGIERLSIGEQEKQRMLAGTALAWLGLEADRFPHAA